MRKEIISLSIVSIMAVLPCMCLADTNYTVIEPVIQPMTASYETSSNDYQTQQYPLPVNSYQTQGYDYNQGSVGQFQGNFSQLQGNVVMVPANTTFPAVVMTPLSTESAKLGDSVSFYLPSDFYYGNRLIAGAGSKVNGTVILAKKGSFAHRQGKLQVRFTNITTPSGQTIPISASIQTTDGTGILKAGTVKDTTKEYVKDAAIGAAAGAVLGTALGALSGGSVGKGAVYGTAVGGGLGVAQNIFDKGGNIDIPQNAQMNIILDQPVTVSANTPY